MTIEAEVETELETEPEATVDATLVDAAQAVDGEGEGLDHPLAQDLLFNPTRWQIWPTVAIARWLLRDTSLTMRGLVYRSKPSLEFSGSEVHDIVLQQETIDLVLTAPGLAAPGSILPTPDIARVIADATKPGGGSLAAWLDGPTDRFMHAVEAARARHNAAFALATGGRIEALRSVADLAGRSAPLTARQGGILSSSFEDEPGGAVGLAALFLGTPSASGLEALVTAYTGLAARVDEFTGAVGDVKYPARLGRQIGRVLGSRCEMPAAGLTVVVRGLSNPSAPAWAQDAGRRRSLLRLCAAYVGGALPEVEAFLELDADNTAPARLNVAALGGLAVLGKPSSRVRLPLH